MVLICTFHFWLEDSSEVENGWPRNPLKQKWIPVLYLILYAVRICVVVILLSMFDITLLVVGIR